MAVNELSLRVMPKNKVCLCYHKSMATHTITITSISLCGCVKGNNRTV